MKHNLLRIQRYMGQCCIMFTIKKRKTKTNLVLNSYVLKNVLLVFVLVFCGYIFFKFSEPKNAV